MPKIVYLNGPSSAGKTLLAKALQEAFDEPFLNLSIDKIIGFMPPKINNWEGGDAPLGFCWKRDTDPTGHTTYHVQAGPFAKKIVRSMKDIALLLASQDYNLIIDDVAFGAVEVEEWKEALVAYSVIYVGVKAPLEVLEKREKTRDDRFSGSARDQYFKVHKNVVYDLEVDTHSDTLKENALKICAELLKN